MESNRDWKPTVGQKAWYFNPSNMKQIVSGTIAKFSEGQGLYAYFNEPATDILVAVRHISLLFPSALDALKSIQILDIAGNPVDLVLTFPALICGNEGEGYLSAPLKNYTEATYGK